MELQQPRFDDDGQPLSLVWNCQRRIDAGIDELIGLIRGILADGVVTESETNALAGWVARHCDIAREWPVNVLLSRLNRIYADGRVDEDERDDLKALLIEVVGEKDNLLAPATTTLPLHRPAPEVIFDQNVFVFTGKFAFGPRRVCEAEVIARGGKTANYVTLQTSYVVIGSVGSRDWIHTAWSRKIEKAVEYQHSCAIAIISEQHWTRFLLPALDPHVRRRA